MTSFFVLKCVVEPAASYILSSLITDLKDCFLFRPRLPQKLRTGKQWNQDGGSPGSPARVSVASSVSATSLNYINESDELTCASEEVVVPTLTIDRRAPARSPSPKPKVMNPKSFNSFHTVNINKNFESPTYNQFVSNLANHVALFCPHDDILVPGEV